MNRNTLLGFAAATMIGLSTAHAACPTADDLGHGIFVQFDDNTYSRYLGSATGDILEENTLMDRGGGRYIYTMKAGFLQTRWMFVKEGQIDPKTDISYDYSGGLDGLASLEPGKELYLQGVETTPTETKEITTLIKKGQAQELVIQDCTYRAFPITLEKTAGSDAFLERYLLVDELGIAILQQFVDASSNATDYRILGIGTDFPVAQRR